MTYGCTATRIGPHLVRSASTSALIAFTLVLAAAVSLGWLLDFGAFYVPKVLIAYLVVLTLMVWFLHDHRPHRRLGSANQVTLGRAMLGALLFGLLGEGTSEEVAWVAFALAVIAETLDGVDGRLARRGGWVSPFGARFDMEADALLVAVLCLLAWYLDKAGIWILAAGLMRYAFVAASYPLPWLRAPLPRSRRRQSVCVVQVLTLTIAVAPLVPAGSSALVAAAGLALLCYSFAVDIFWLARRAGVSVQPGEETCV